MRFFLLFFILVFFNGCFHTYNQRKHTIVKPVMIQKQALSKNQIEFVSNSLNSTIINIANQLFNSNSNQKTPLRIILTSFVDLNNFDKTSTFGRLISESMFNELHIRNFKISDFRGQDAVSVNDNGEFHITRNVERLKDSIESTEFILIGTYVKFENQSLLINARIVDSISGEVVSSARAVYQPKDCKTFGICENLETEEEKMNRKYNIYDTSTITTNENKSQFAIIPDKKTK